VDVQRHAPAAYPPGKRPGTGGRLDRRVGLEGGVKTHPHRSDHRNVQSVAGRYTGTLSRPVMHTYIKERHVMRMSC
jgi:hypothetical protein